MNGKPQRIIKIRITGNTTGAGSTNGGLLQSCGNYPLNGNKTERHMPPSRSTEDPRADLGMVEGGCIAGLATLSGQL